MLLVGADDRQQQGWLALLLRAPEASLAVGWRVVAERFEARFLGAESTASAEPESYRTPRRCLRAVRQQQQGQSPLNNLDVGLSGLSGPQRS